MGDIQTPDYQGPDRRKVAREEPDQGSKLALSSRSTERAHRTDQIVEEEAITEINVTPLVDVALCLVIIFMAVSPFMLQAGLQVTESKAGAATGKHSLNENVQVTLSADNKISINGVGVQIADLLSELRPALAKSKDGLVTVQADKSNHVG